MFVRTLGHVVTSLDDQRYVLINVNSDTSMFVKRLSGSRRFTSSLETSFSLRLCVQHKDSEAFAHSKFRCPVRSDRQPFSHRVASAQRPRQLLVARGHECFYEQRPFNLLTEYAVACTRYCTPVLHHCLSFRNSRELTRLSFVAVRRQNKSHVSRLPRQCPCEVRLIEPRRELATVVREESI